MELAGLGWSLQRVRDVSNGGGNDPEVGRLWLTQSPLMLST